MTKTSKMLIFALLIAQPLSAKAQGHIKTSPNTSVKCEATLATLTDAYLDGDFGSVKEFEEYYNRGETHDQIETLKTCKIDLAEVLK